MDGDKTVMDITLHALHDNRITQPQTERQLIKNLLFEVYGLALEESKSLTQMTDSFKRIVNDL